MAKLTPEQYQQKLKELPQKAQDSVRRGLYTIMLKVEAESARRAPVKTGYLRNSRNIAFNPKEKGFEGRLKYNAEYAAPVHYGRRTSGGRTKAQPFLDEGMEASRNFINKTVEKTIEETLNNL